MTDDSGLFYLNPAHRLPADLVEVDYPVLVDVTGTLGDVPAEPPPGPGAAGWLCAAALATVAALALAGSIAAFITTHPVTPLPEPEAISPLSAPAIDPRIRLASRSDPSPEPSLRSSWVRVIPVPARSGISRSWRVEPEPREAIPALGSLPPDPARWPCPVGFPQWCRPGRGGLQ